MRFFSSIKVVRVSLALAVALWMAGAGCMLGCGGMVGAAASGVVSSVTPPAVVTGEACASMQSHDCCAKHGAHSAAKAAAKSQTEETTSFIVPSLAGTFPTMMDCPLAVNAAAELSNPRLDHSNVALLSSSATASLPNSLGQKNGFARPLRLPNRGHTYLRCCVFLI